jgi:hypothetical protein
MHRYIVSGVRAVHHGPATDTVAAVRWVRKGSLSLCIDVDLHRVSYKESGLVNSR